MLDVRPDKQWLTAAEAAAEQLPGFEFSEQYIRKLLVARQLGARPRVSSGGRPGREFHWSDLPPTARAAYLKKYGVAAAAPEGPRDRHLEAEARALIVDRARAFAAERNLTNGKGMKAFCAAYAKRRGGLEPWVYETIARLEPHRVVSWERKLRGGGTKALVDGRGRPKGSSWIEADADLRVFIVATIAARPHLSACAVRKEVAAQLQRDVPLRTLQAFLATLKRNNRAVMKALTDPDRARSHHKPAFGSLSMNISRLNQLWEIDATRADVMCLIDGAQRRFALTALIDVYSRRARVVVSDQPRGLATQALLRRAITDFGLPEVLKADNGKEYKNYAVERFCRDTGILLDFSRPFSPEEKGHIERFFKTLSHGLLELLPGYVAHDIAGRKAIENRRSFAHRFGEEAQLAIEISLSPAELQARIDAWLADVYEQRPHSSLGMTPAAKALAHAGDARRLENIRALDLLLLDHPDGHGIRNVGKRGVRVENIFYIAPELGEFMGQRVQVKLDPLDPSIAVIYRADHNEFICVARDAESLDGDSRMRVAIGAQVAQRRMISQVRADVRKVQRLHPPQGLADRMLRLAARNDFSSCPVGASMGHARISDVPTLGAEANAAGDFFSLSPESRRAMADAASRPALMEHAKALDAVAESRLPEKPAVLTDEDRAGAVAFLDSVTPRLPAPGLVQCEGYTRPFFEGDVEFFLWLDAHSSMLDASDAAELARMRGNHTFQILVKQTAARARALAGAAA